MRQSMALALYLLCGVIVTWLIFGFDIWAVLHIPLWPVFLVLWLVKISIYTLALVGLLGIGYVVYRLRR